MTKIALTIIGGIFAIVLVTIVTLAVLFGMCIT